MAGPDLQQILDDKKDLEAAWELTHKQWSEVDTFTDGTYEVWSKEQQEIAPRNTERTNLGRIIVDHTSDNLLPYKPKFKRDPIGQRDPLQRADDAQDKADRVEEVAGALWLDASQGEMALPTKVAGRYMLKYNYAVLETGFDISGMPEPPERGDPAFETKNREFEERRWNFNPFWATAPHPYTVLLPPRSRVPELAVKRMRWYRRDLKRYLDGKREAHEDNLVSVAEFDFAGNGYDMVEVVEHFLPDYHSLTSTEGGSKVLLQEEQFHRVLPFTHAWGGFADTVTGEDGMAPERLGQGLLWPIRDLLRQYDQIRSAKMELEMKAAYGLLVTEGDALQLAQQMASGGNAIIGGVSLKDIGFLPIPQLPQFLADLEQRIFQEIVLGTVPLAAFGQRDVGVDTVGQHAMMLQVSAKRFLESMEQMSFMVSQIMSMWFKIIVTWGEQFAVRGVDITPSLFQSNYHILTTFPMSDEAVKMQRIQQGAALVSQGLKSRKRHWEEDQMLNNVSEERDQILEEAVLSDPIMITALAEKKRRELGLKEIYEEQLARMAQERMQGFAETQAEQGTESFTPPATEEEGQIRGAITDEVLRPAPASAGTGQRE